MKNLIFIFFLLAISFTIAKAQELPATEQEWALFTPAKERFSVEIPKGQISYSVTDYGDNKRRRFRLRCDDAYFDLYSVSNRSDTPYDILKDFAKVHKVTPTDVVIGEHKGKRYDIDEDFYHTFVFLETPYRFLIFHAYSPDRSHPAIERFIDSIKILSKESKEGSHPDLETIARQPLPRYVKASTDDQKEDAKSKPTDDLKNLQDVQNSGVKLLSVPRPQRAKMDGYYAPRGKVVVSVTFMADGRIGEVVPIVKMPFGLTTSAVNAIKLTKFEPEKVDGQPVTVKKAMTVVFH